MCKLKFKDYADFIKQDGRKPTKLMTFNPNTGNFDVRKMSDRPLADGSKIDIYFEEDNAVYGVSIDLDTLENQYFSGGIIRPVDEKQTAFDLEKVHLEDISKSFEEWIRENYKDEFANLRISLLTSTRKRHEQAIAEINAEINKLKRMKRQHNGSLEV